MTTKDIYEIVSKNPTDYNKQLFLLAHKPYIGSIVVRWLPQLQAEDQDDIISDIFVHQIKKDKIDYTQPYYKVKGYLARSTYHYIVNRYQEKQQLNYKHMITNLEEFQWNSLSKQDIKNDYLLEDILSYAKTEREKIVVNLYYRGYTFEEIGKHLELKGKGYPCYILKELGKRMLKNGYKIQY